MTFFDNLFAALPEIVDQHSPHGPLWKVLNDAAARNVTEQFRDADTVYRPFGPFGDIALPYFEMGAINSTHLFGMDELILFAFYHANRGRYRRAVDFGANIGLHSIIMSKCGYAVRGFEPDQHHADIYRSNMTHNKVEPELHQAAVSLEDGKTEFVRVLGNTTGSHIKGAKAAPYGELETFEVTLEAAEPHLEWADFAKIDIEGHEAELLTGLSPDIWLNTDAILEVGTEENAKRIFAHLQGSGVNMLSQKINWGPATSVDDLPFSHRDGSLFLTAKDRMPW